MRVAVGVEVPPSLDLADHQLQLLAQEVDVLQAEAHRGFELEHVAMRTVATQQDPLLFQSEKDDSTERG